MQRGRQKVRPQDVANAATRTEYIRDPWNYNVNKLYTNLSIPSYVHGYSLAIEFMRDWFLEKFPKDYFKTVYINGKHVLDDYRNFNRDIIKREKPMVAITPTVEYDFDREYLDLYQAPPDIFLRRSGFQDAFFKDNDTNQYLGFNLQGIRMNFNFRIRVASRAQQLDLFKRMELMFRIGATQSKYVSADFHIPKEIMLSIAKLSGFDVDEEEGKINDIIEFIGYMNSHSDLPIMFKMRAINQKPEFFLRADDLYTHIATKDKLNLDDGEREGQLDNNFHIEMSATLTMPVPHFYVYYSAKDLYRGIIMQETKNTVGLYSFSTWQIPEENDRGWPQLIITSYAAEKGEESADLSELFSGDTNLDRIIEHNLQNYISAGSFVDVQVYRNDDRAKHIRSVMDWGTKTVHFLDLVDEEMLNIVIYADKEYVNDTSITLRELDKTRTESTNI